METLQTPEWKLDHIGHAVENLAQALKFYQGTLGFLLEERETLHTELVDIVFLRAGTANNPTNSPGATGATGAAGATGAFDASGPSVPTTPLIELIAPLPGNRSLEKFLKNRGAGIHHLCFRVSSVKDELARFKSLGIQLIDEKPRQGSRGMDVAFLHPRSCNGALLEICSKP